MKLPAPSNFLFSPISSEGTIRLTLVPSTVGSTLITSDFTSYAYVEFYIGMPILSIRVAMVTPVISRTYVLHAELLIFDVQHVFDTELGIALVNGPSKATAAVGIATVVGCFGAVQTVTVRPYRSIVSFALE